MAKHENILSFDEARARGSVSSSPKSTQSSSSYSRSRKTTAVSNKPQRYTHDPSFEQAFSGSVRAGSYSKTYRNSTPAVQTNSRRPVDHSVSNSYSANQPYTRVSSQANKSGARRETAVYEQGREKIETQQDKVAQSREKQREKQTNLKHRVRSARAERQFNKTIGVNEASNAQQEQTSRPALYEMKMGKTHKRSSRMQNNAKSGKHQGFFSWLVDVLTHPNHASNRVASRVLVSCCVFVFMFAMLYQPVANYYQEIRGQQQLEAEYEVVSDYYSSLKSEVDYLNTQEGLEEYVREELGWVKSGEQVVSVDGLAVRDATQKKDTVTSDLSNSVPTPETWYSPVLDVVFGYTQA